MQNCIQTPNELSSNTTNISRVLNVTKKIILCYTITRKRNIYSIQIYSAGGLTRDLTTLIFFNPKLYSVLFTI